MIRKDLVIETERSLIFLDTSKTEEITMDCVKYVDKKYDNYFSGLMVPNKTQSNDSFVYQKTVQGNYLLFKSSLYDNVVILLNVFNPNSKLSSNNDFNFNIKVPIIFLSIIIIAIYQYNKKKNEDNSGNPEHDKMKEEMIEQIKMLTKGGKLVNSVLIKKPKEKAKVVSSTKRKPESESEDYSDE